MHYRKSNKPKFLLMLVALLALFAVSIGFTYSWIEGGATYTIQSDDVNEPIKTDSIPESVTYSGKITLNPNSSSKIELFNYDENTGKYQNLYFSPVSSKDGEKFLFPVKDSNGNVTFYRESNINDVGTKFINYDFDFTSARKCFLAFDGTPSIKVTKSGSTISDTSAFRIMIKCGDDQYIFTTANSEKTSTVATDSNGTPATLTALPIGNYVNNTAKTARLFDYNKGYKGNIELSVWLDEGSDFTEILGSDVELNLNLIAVLTDLNAEFSAASYDRNGNKLTNVFAGGSIKCDSTTYNQAFTKVGTTFKATAVANAGYEFKGWYSDADCTKLITESKDLNHTPDDDTSYYAKFQETSKTTIYVEPRSGFSTYSIWAYQKFGSDTHHYSGDTWPGESAVLDSTTGYYKYEFTTPDTGQFRVIISNKGADEGRYPGSNEEGLPGDIGGTYLFTADNTLIKFNPADMITLNVSSLGGGSATVNNDDSVIVRPGATVNIKATASSGYRFVGWYKDASCTTTIGTNFETASQTITMSAEDAGKTLNYYAKFEKIPVLTVKTSVTPTGSGTATVNNASSVSVQTGTNVTLKATPASGYQFVGWYTNQACTTTTGITNPTSATSATYTVSGSNGATVTLYAKFEEIPGKTIYFDPSSSWEEDNARFAVYVFNNSKSTHAWFDMTDTDGDGIYSAIISDENWPNVIFCRMNPSTSSNNFNNGTRWNQTVDLTMPSNNNDMFKLSSGWSDNGVWLVHPNSLGSASTVTITLKDSTSSSWVDDSSAVIILVDDVTGNSYRMTSSATSTWKVTIPSSVTDISIKRRDPAGLHNSSWNSWSPSARGSKTTLTITDGSTAKWS